MKRRFAYLIIVGMALTGGPHTVMPASQAPQSVADVDVLVDGAPQRRYVHDGRSYVEAFKGREYAIRLRNRLPVRVAVALSVDGLNTIDARHTTAADARKWVLDPYETVTIGGWQTSQTRGAPLRIHNRGALVRSGARQDRQPGVISAVFFKERRAGHHARTDVEDERSAAGRQRRRRRRRSRQESCVGCRASTASRTTMSIAATGMGRRTGHAVTQVWLNLEDSTRANGEHPLRVPCAARQARRSAVHVPQSNPLQRRERAHGFEPGFCPEPPRRP